MKNIVAHVIEHFKNYFSHQDIHESNIQLRACSRLKEKCGGGINLSCIIREN